MLNLDEIWLAEYSVTQGAFQVETAKQAAESNLRQVLAGWTNSYLPFAFCSSDEEAIQACEALHDAQEKRTARQSDIPADIEREATQARQGDAGQAQDADKQETVKTTTETN